MASPGWLLTRPMGAGRGAGLAAAPYDPRASYSRWGYLVSFFGVADMVAFLPFWLELYWTAHGIPYDFALPRVLRLMRYARQWS